MFWHLLRRQIEEFVRVGLLELDRSLSRQLLHKLAQRFAIFLVVFTGLRIHSFLLGHGLNPAFLPLELVLAHQAHQVGCAERRRLLLSIGGKEA